MTHRSENESLPRYFPGYIINLLFLIGLLSALAFRSIIVLSHIDQALMRLVWYIGMIGYILFFSYRYYVALKRRKVIHKYGLISKIDMENPLSAEEKEAVKYLLSSLMRSREIFNYLAIFLLSLLAVAIDMVMVHMGK